MIHPLIRAAADYWRLDAEDLVGKRRFVELVKARAAVAYVLRERDRLSYPNIGRRLGGRDHTTILNLMGNCRNYLTHNDFKQFVDAQMDSSASASPAVFVSSPIPDPVQDEPVPTSDRYMLPPCPPHLVRLRKEKTFETVKPVAGKTFRMDDNGDCPDDRFSWKDVAAGSQALFAAIQRAHPERFAA